MTERPFLPAELRAQRRFQAMLGQGLSRQYAETAAEPVPEEYLRLLLRAGHIPSSREPAA
jgi:hypothetical protein